MYCKQCNTYLPDGTAYCTNCGAAVTADQSVIVESGNSYKPAPAGNTNAPLIWGILGLSFSCSVYFSLLGLIFSIIGKNKAKQYIATYGNISGKVKVGKGLATAGLIVGIIFTAIMSLVVIAAIAEAM